MKIVLKKITNFIEELGFKFTTTHSYYTNDYNLNLDTIRIVNYENYIQIVFFINGICRDVVNIYRNSVNLTEFYSCVDLFHKEKFRKYKISKLLKDNVLREK